MQCRGQWPTQETTANEAALELGAYPSSSPGRTCNKSGPCADQIRNAPPLSWQIRANSFPQIQLGACIRSWVCNPVHEFWTCCFISCNLCMSAMSHDNVAASTCLINMSVPSFPHWKTANSLVLGVWASRSTYFRAKMFMTLSFLTFPNFLNQSRCVCVCVRACVCVCV